MKNLIFATKINNSDLSGIIDISKNPPEIFCYCSKEVSKEILDLFNRKKNNLNNTLIIDKYAELIKNSHSHSLNIEELKIILKDFAENYKSEKTKSFKINGFSNCPFCGGTKTKPFVQSGKSQNCTDCNENGKIKNSKLLDLDLQDMIEKK